MNKKVAWGTQDLLLLLMMTMTALVFMLLTCVNPVAKSDKDNTSSPPGVVSVEIIWPNELDADVDLWVQAPGDIPVGYSNKGGAIFNLLRDDLGRILDLSDLNYENAYSRGIWAGKYVVNVMLYRNQSGKAEVPVKVIVSSRQNNESLRQILVSNVTLDTTGQELTVFRFDLEKDGSLVKGSVDSLDTPLRNLSGKK